MQNRAIAKNVQIKNVPPHAKPNATKQNVQLVYVNSVYKQQWAVKAHCCLLMLPCLGLPQPGHRIVQPFEPKRTGHAIIFDGFNSAIDESNG